MRFPTKSAGGKQALLCALALSICVCLTHPVAEIGMNDDWSYISLARHLAETGHISYNGWASPILGVQLIVGALFIKLFGFSFTVTRVPVFLLGIACAALLQRTLVRAGLRDRNATFGTLCIVMSPLFLPLVFSFMTDVPALFFIVLCLYCCLRALQAESIRSALFWLSLGAATNVLGAC